MKGCIKYSLSRLMGAEHGQGVVEFAQGYSIGMRPTQTDGGFQNDGWHLSVNKQLVKCAYLGVRCQISGNDGHVPLLQVK